MPKFSTILLSLLSFVSWAKPGMASREYVKSHLPEFYEVVASEVSEMELADLFMGWGPMEVSQFRIAESRMQEVFRRSGASTFTEAKAFSLFGNFIYSVVGEIYLASYIRALYEYDADVIALDERQLNRLTAQQISRPDGLVYRIDGHHLYIINVAESKMGLQTFDAQQSQKYFQHWQNHGLKVLDHDFQTQRFSPQHIFIVHGFRWFADDSIRRNPDGDIFLEVDLNDGYESAIPLLETTHRQFQEITLTVGSQVRGDTLHQYISMPFGTETLRKIAMSFAIKMLNIKIDVVEPPSLDRVQQETKQKALSMSDVDFRHHLSQWFMSQTSVPWQWPKPSLSFGGIDGAVLRRALTERKSQANAFIYFTNQELKMLLAKNGALPPKQNLYSLLSRAHEIDSDALDAVRVSLEFFEGFLPHQGRQKFMESEIIRRVAPIMIRDRRADSLQKVFLLLYPCQNLFDAT